MSGVEWLETEGLKAAAAAAAAAAATADPLWGVGWSGVNLWGDDWGGCVPAVSAGVGGTGGANIGMGAWSDATGVTGAASTGSTCRGVCLNHTATF